MVADPEKILDYLNQHYYPYQKSLSVRAGGAGGGGVGDSADTSSHWLAFGKLQQMHKDDLGWSLRGVGFGEYKQRTLKNFLLTLPSQLILRFLFRRLPYLLRATVEHLAYLSGRIICHDLFRMASTIQLLQSHIPGLGGMKIAIIGDGYGSLGCLLKLLYPKCQITFINLGRTLAFDVFYAARSHPDSHHVLITDEFQESSADFNYIEAEKVFLIKPQADLFVNIASMQEMNPSIIRRYFGLMRRQPGGTLFYCCNRIEKTLPDGTTTRFSDYGWLASDKIIFDGLCPWHQISPMNRPPFFRRFEGPTRHRLSDLSTLV